MMSVMEELTAYCRDSHFPFRLDDEEGPDVNLLFCRRCVLGIFVIVVSACFLLFLPSQVKAETGKMNVSPNSSFENDLTNIKTNICVFGGWFPIGVVTEDGGSEIKIVNDIARTGKHCLRVTPNTKTLRGTIYYSQYNAGEEVRRDRTSRGVKGARTIAFRLDRDIVSCDVSVWVKKASSQEISLKTIWYTRRNRRPFIKIGERAVTGPIETKDQWAKYLLHVDRPDSARQVQIAVETDGDGVFYLDDAEIYFNRKGHIDILVDQLGYETRSDAKGIILQSSTAIGSSGKFSMINSADSTVVFTGKWRERGYLRQWDLYHWEGDFSDFKVPGRYFVKTKIDGVVHSSVPFEIGDDLLVKKTSELAYRFFYYQRCGTAVEGFHEACHLDDAKMPDGSYKDLSGGWHDAGDYNKYNGYTPESVWALVFAYDRRQEFFDQFDRDKNGRADILDEAVWGAKFLTKCIDLETLEMINSISTGYGYWGRPGKETDNLARSGDERPVREGTGDARGCVRGFALLGKYVPEYVAFAERLYKKYGGDMQTMLALYDATEKKVYREAARKRAATQVESGKGSSAGFRELAEYAVGFPQDPLVGAIKTVAKKRMEELVDICDNPFKIIQRRDDDGKSIYFLHYRDVNNWHVGETRELLDTAYEGILLDKLGFGRGRGIAENQVHWILGRNPYGVSTMEGVGSIFVPQYHHRYNTLPKNPRGAVPGALINGIVRAWPDHDRPWLDMHAEPNADYQCNEPWLPHNNRWLFLIAIW